MPDWYMELLKDYEKEWKREKLKAGKLWEGGFHEYLFHSGTGKPFYFTTPTTK
ncbi:hypothetical protein [Salimicrobium humidisoli]|uniref:hypothetical protein n=1 Tax=Salimicrobium humidisoli TaxID=2029857 RepID=UPI001303F872|nr:hypothetical protein [Salimicrobium humidisoli]